MIIFYQPNGAIVGGCAANSPNDMAGITKIPDGCNAIYLDDTQWGAVWTNMSEYTIQNGVPVYTPISDATKLANAQQAKITQLESARESVITAGFTSTADGTSRTYKSDKDSQDLMDQESTAMALGIAVFPQTWTAADGTVVSLSDVQFKQLVTDFRAFKKQQWDHFQQLALQVRQAATVSEVNAIVW